MPARLVLTHTRQINFETEQPQKVFCYALPMGLTLDGRPVRGDGRFGIRHCGRPPVLWENRTLAHELIRVVLRPAMAEARRSRQAIASR
jgi:hypothetical protein